MKKLYALLVAGVLTVAMALPVFASNSPNTGSNSATADSSDDSTENYSPEAVSAMTGGSTIATTVGNTSVNQIGGLAEEVVKVTTDTKVLSDLGVSTDAKLMAMVDVSYTGAIPAGGVQIPFNVSGIAKKGDLVYILHRVESDARHPWEVVGQAIVGDNLSVTGTFKSFSPVAFLVVDSSKVAAAGVKAPKTGEF